jgi:sigma-54 specific flagellar transcriptional regulator A
MIEARLNSGARAKDIIIGESAAMVEIRRLIGQVAPSSASVLITGPSGSGKEMVARAIHAESRRSAKSYVAVNCGAIPRELLESELFGHEKGSFTGAIAQRRGRFEEAHDGTLFLDEIGDMPADMQVKLLRVLEERSIQRIGGRGEIDVDTRIISATHRNIEESIAGQRFREDLFYRLAVFPIEIPSLAERREDIPLLINHFLRAGAASVRFTPDAMDRLAGHEWPGNVRELRNIVDRAGILYRDQLIGREQVELVLCRRRKGDTLATPLPPRAERRQAPAEPIVEEDPAAAAPAAVEPSFGEGPVDLRKLM